MNRSRLALVLVIVIVTAVLVLWRSGEKEILPNLADADSLRQTPSGNVVGFSDQHQTHAWLGIPYAQAPTGNRRWRAPLPLEPWQGTLEALAYSPPCTQLWGQVSGIDDGNDGDVVGDEDCLYLNIWAPAFAPGEVPVAGDGLPVMVWIHGGGNTIGTANTYQGHHLAASQQVIYVGINYRLGLLGWFSHEALRNDADNALDSSGNYGILDMIAALKWVRDNIADFGGDPDNVTIFGESAGGRNVYALVGSPLAAGLFHRAISQSGSMQTSPLARAENLADAEVPGDTNSSSEVLASLLQADGGAEDRDEAISQLAQMSPAEIKNYLYRKTPSELYSIMGAPPFGMFQIPQNFRDGTVLPLESLLQRFGDTALYNNVPMILGSNRDEYKVFTAQDPRFVQRRFGFLPRVIDQAGYDRFNGYFSDQWKALAVDEPAQVLSDSQGPTIYAYRFDWDEAPSNWMVDFPKLLGAGHGLEVSFVFGDFEGGISVPYLLNDENEPGRTALSTAMMNYWGEFAHSGAPGRGRDNQQPPWQPWGTRGQTFLVLDTPQDGNIHMSNERVTAAALKQRLAADTLFEEPEQRCALYAGLFLLSYQSADFWDEDEFRQLGNGTCAAYSPYDFADQFR